MHIITPNRRSSIIYKATNANFILVFNVFPSSILIENASNPKLVFTTKVILVINIESMIMSITGRPFFLLITRCII